LEKLAAPIALYPDELIATVLPASAYPLEIVQAARFVADTNNLAKIDEQPWDDNVKAVARISQVITQMNDNIAWTSDLGDAFINQPKELMNAIQTMRGKAQESGALKTTPEQVVTVTNTVVTNVVDQKTVYVTNQVVQIQPAQPEVIYVPQYNPTVVYAGYPVAYPGYAYPPYYGSAAAASVVSFGVGMAVGAVIANNCDWHGGGVYVGPRGGVYAGGGWGGGDVDVDVNRNVNVNQTANRANVNRTSTANNANVQNRSAQGQKWQPDQSRLNQSGSTATSTQSREARGWNSASGQATPRTTSAGTGSAAGQAGTTAAQNRSTASGANRSSGEAASGAAAANRSGGQSAAGSGSRDATRSASQTPSSSRAAGGSGSQSASTPRTTASGGGSGSQSSAFSGVQNGASESAASQRGSASRSGGGSGSYSGSSGAARSAGGSSSGSGAGAARSSGGGARSGGGGRGGGGGGRR